MKKTTVLTYSAFFALASSSLAWTTIDLPDRVSGQNTAMSHLDDGRLVYAHDGSMYQQDTFGGSAFTSYTNAPVGGYAYVTGNGFLGVGSFGGTAPIYDYTASNTGTAFNSVGSLQNYAAVAYTADSILLSGANGATSEIGHFNQAGTYTTIVSDVSTFSAGLTLDATGNLYVADNDDLNIYRFTAAQVAASLAGTTLSIADGEYITNMGVSGSLAVDSLGRLYAAGWQLNGIQVYDMVNSVTNSLIPLGDNANYVVTAFSDGSDDYVGWLNASGYGNGDSVVYGYDLDGNIVVPEPSTYALLAGLLSCAAVFGRRRK